jgi:hypothetical protein
MSEPDRLNHTLPSLDKRVENVFNTLVEFLLVQVGTRTFPTMLRTMGLQVSVPNQFDKDGLIQVVLQVEGKQYVLNRWQYQNLLDGTSPVQLWPSVPTSREDTIQVRRVPATPSWLEQALLLNVQFGGAAAAKHIAQTVDLPEGEAKHLLHLIKHGTRSIERRAVANEHRGEVVGSLLDNIDDALRQSQRVHIPVVFRPTAAAAAHDPEQDLNHIGS